MHGKGHCAGVELNRLIEDNDDTDHARPLRARETRNISVRSDAGDLWRDNRASSRYRSNAIVARVGDQKIALPAKEQSSRLTELSGNCRYPIAVKAGATCARDGGDDAAHAVDAA